MEAPKLTIARARELRRRPSLPEALLWARLRGQRLAGLRFRRQHPVGPYILDFYCVAVRLAVEVDGRVHDDPDRQAHDERRTNWLNGQGIQVLRIAAMSVFQNMDGVLEGIRLRAADPLHHAAHGPPPPEGEE
ncbi:very-short-patch-repair endonuclease [Brevundimonas alba]|uniref:Very-short-patch-repair endonuclease n=1 Tax=Brevundimonas alba TaxID=74314 RepID=A0A7X5YPZ5_9CAUL|nr:endonuclease domain-containing protein [Brevundimonas alba]NJC42714.1 very-short-patch-repair endonuclease [Brevundimonas alba]